MGNFRDNRGGGGRDFGNRGSGGYQGGDREMHKATCSNCGKECEVPFRPTGSKPVYCNDCFRSMGNSDSRGNDRRSDDRGPRRSGFDGGHKSPSYPQYKEQFESLNAKLDKVLELLGQSESPKKTAKPTTPKSEAAPVADKAPVVDVIPVSEPAPIVEEATPATESPVEELLSA